ncbi:DUF5518 domain-containing protein [Methanobacterium ferruginis]|uniref:DUF5518 domain-containing protein n=1 Tax=Methanobacterium ferruginis TaxID=710191 RepID=UPI0025734EEA|nr:DUF5518 domain-containing protein [Methanobacterium ferruginis]BDZ67559.1 hypothetical protein GCM10025860_10070 [Methanobacterium ferruginis]
MDWKIIGISALLSVVLTIILSLIWVPLIFLGPLTGGFLASYLSRGYEYYDKMDKKDGAVVGSVSGLIGGLIIGSLFLLGIGDVNVIIKLISSQLGAISNKTLIIGYIILQLSIIISFVLGLIGGILGVSQKE